ncbi:(R,R)-butanediol dehydrogenase / meso-butanediol dehydrogenase / diacetyl reductase/D-lactate dehydrogenase (cytochrome) [Rhizobium sp. RU35A]|uniref:FAD-binding oxidoreductase n=1 Tax=Rhizobium sp. RU35A TaxID=1907414 RepID=UPI000956CB36|nr:FAD-linked oxidase C-terminal domain-containing protein [Rhizobium sp. RU35A]SIQ55161.1 (R,R)-butanediol dehydrogenase / meso-butanediol dehydrogenase / diacetyl reductase/D-lactate dehydrogenase (cytochrome) [Rhizobium sp. RU35A]
MVMRDVQTGQRNEGGIASVLGILKQQLGEKLQTGQAFREQHAHTTTYLPRQIPDGVVFAESVEDVKAVVKACATHRVPVIPFGTGSSLEGQVNAPSGGISLDFSRMDKVLRVSPEDLDVTVQPGVTREALNTYLRDTGLFFPIDPGANASIGGMTATRASGTNAVRYGTMKDNVLSLTVVTADGEEIVTGTRAKKSSAGYDLTRLFVGSEGTLGVITSITLKLQGIPEKIGGGVCSFPTVKAACDAVIMTIQMGIPVARIELLDEMQMRACNAYSGLSYDEKPTLFVEFHGTEDTVPMQSEQFSMIAAECGGEDFQFTGDAQQRAKLWKARHDAYWAARALAPHLGALSTDVCVPISRLADCVAETHADIRDSGFLGPIVGHAGDGNFHILLLFDEKDPADIARAEAFVERLNRRALSMDGTCTGEHGIGQGKMSFLEQEASSSLPLMRAIKKTLDPQDIFNPGKILRPGA